MGNEKKIDPRAQTNNAETTLPRSAVTPTAGDTLSGRNSPLGQAARGAGIPPVGGRDAQLAHDRDSRKDERGWPAAARGNDAAPGYESRDLLRRLTEQATQINTLKSSVEQQRADIRKTESSLMTRLAGVDEDRRLTASQSQKTWQSNREEIDGSLRRQGTMTAIGFLLFGVLVAVAMAFLYSRFENGRKAAVDEIAELRQAIQQVQVKLPDNVAQNQLTQEKLLNLSLAIKSMSKTLDSLGEAAPVSEASGKEPADSGSSTDATQQEAKAKADAEMIAKAEADARAAKEKAEADARQAKAEADSRPLQAHEPTPPREPSRASESAPTPNEKAPDTPLVSNAAESAAEPVSGNIRVGETPYSLQLIGFFSLEKLLSYTRIAPLPSRVYYKQETYRGRPWFALIHSLHASRESANAAISDLPAELAKLDLWVRQLDPNSSLTPLKADSD
ncbi:SPOR domain-containing protein [Thiocystis violascens]|uniref:SPOR domain-containing protein n=1 Tax=Thiocystis violascens (strain ATCC 17096 / DSM 198 / 6111) TaxID=765911 RepID=I3Y5H7_THIV6|nr:hypothetical protein [Thiocystis violascens]AFL72245.1 hypothetical protein Thivi_0171 [Thiocystis violascens DSM 198]